MEKKKMPVIAPETDALDLARSKAALLSGHYLNLKGQAKRNEAEVKTTGDQLRGLLPSLGLEPVSGTAHHQVELTLADGQTQVLLRDQVAEKVTLVPDVLLRLRALLGEEAEQYIEKVEMLRPSALESLVMAGRLSEAQLKALTETKQQHSLIVQLAPKK